MSQPPPSGGRSTIPSPRPSQAKTTSGQANTSTQAESSTGQLSVAPAGTRGPAWRQGRDPSPTPENTVHPQSRGFGVHSILNPSSESVSRTPTEIGSTTANPSILPPPTASPRSRKRAEPASPTRTQFGSALSAPSRRVLTPRSPARGTSLGSRRNPTFHATGSPLQSLAGPEPRIYTAEPGSAEIPALPPFSTAARTAASGVQSSEVWSSQARPQPGPAVPTQNPASIVTTQTASPSTSHTSQSQTEQPSPAFRYGALRGNQQLPPNYGHQSGYGYSIDPIGRGLAESYQAGQPAYQMTLETDQGPMVVPVELDLQQASKLADEKRRRNAGASARFRARRKEKEKEASHTISSLQQDLQDAQDERDFYRNERDFFRDFARRHVGGQLPPRPQSPLFQQQSAASLSVQESNRQPPEDTGRARSDSAPAAHRRRTGDYQPHFGAGPIQQSPVSQPFGSGYHPAPPPPPPGLPLPLGAQTHASAPYASPRSLPPRPPPLPAQRSQSSYDPFRKDPFDRSWNPPR